MQDPSVKRLFTEQLKYYSRPDQSAGCSPVISLFVNWAKNKKNKMQVAEFGGSAGQLLEQIRKKFPKNNYTNIEIIQGYKNKSTCKKIKFINGSILESKIKDSEFDCLIIRDILHHLVGENIKSTIFNQEKALNELLRIVKPNGAIFIEELVEESFLMSRFLYRLLKINSYLKIKISKIDLNPNTIVLFITKNDLEKQVKNIFKNYKIVTRYYRSSDIYQRLGHLGSNSGKMVIEIYKKTT